MRDERWDRPWSIANGDCETVAHGTCRRLAAVQEQHSSFSDLQHIVVRRCGAQRSSIGDARESSPESIISSSELCTYEVFG